MLANLNKLQNLSERSRSGSPMVQFCTRKVVLKNLNWKNLLKKTLKKKPKN